MYYGNIHSNSYFISLIVRERLFHCNICIHVLYCRIYRLKESGILNHMYLHGLSNYTKCLQPSLVSPSKGLRPFELEDFYGVLCVYFGGEDLSMEVQAYKRIYIYLCVYACCVWAIAMYQIWIIASDTNLSFGLILLILFTEIPSQVWSFRCWCFSWSLRCQLQRLERRKGGTRSLILHLLLPVTEPRMT